MIHWIVMEFNWKSASYNTPDAQGVATLMRATFFSVPVAFVTSNFSVRNLLSGSAECETQPPQKKKKVEPHGERATHSAWLDDLSAER
jgi:hypothetical protein